MGQAPSSSAAGESNPPAERAPGHRKGPSVVLVGWGRYGRAARLAALSLTLGKG